MSRTKNIHLKALQYVLEGLSSFMNRGQMWTMVKANRAETQLWLRANIVPLFREVDNPDGSKKTKPRPIELLETLPKLIESADQHADHVVELMQEQQAKSETEQKRRSVQSENS